VKVTKTRKNEFMTIRLPERVAATIRAMADAEKRSYANQVWHLIEVGLKAEQEKVNAKRV
jgi:hypothetical protein